ELLERRARAHLRRPRRPRSTLRLRNARQGLHLGRAPHRSAPRSADRLRGQRRASDRRRLTERRDRSRRSRSSSDRRSRGPPRNGVAPPRGRARTRRRSEHRSSRAKANPPRGPTNEGRKPANETLDVSSASAASFDRILRGVGIAFSLLGPFLGPRRASLRREGSRRGAVGPRFDTTPEYGSSSLSS